MNDMLPLVFNTFSDVVNRSKPVQQPGLMSTTPEGLSGRMLIPGEDRVSYRFYPHFHPYVGELIKRLIEGSVRGLQAADTEYVDPDANGALEVLPNSTVVVLNDDLWVTLPSTGKQKNLKGMRFTIPDGTHVTLPGTQEAALPGRMVLAPRRGMVFLAGKEPVVFDNVDAPLTLRFDTSISLPDGTDVQIPAGTSLILHGCKPKPKLYEKIFSDTRYAPSGLVQQPYPVKDLDFSASGAYSAYNWELFYHVPLTIAIHLSKNQRFEEAMQWFHYVFDPTDDSSGPTPERFWKVKPFQYTDVELIEEILVNLSDPVDPQLQQDTIESIGAWKDAPFRPHVIARYRHTAYMFKAVMAYLDNLIAWGDSLFRQDTGETINEATQLYVLAANLLGPRPQAVPSRGSVRPQTYADLRPDLDEFSNVLRKVEAAIPFSVVPLPNQVASVSPYNAVRSVGQTLYFCVPRNDKLLSYWDTVADRLFKIRNSLNIQGIFRQLPLFEPPIDPALLAKAAAAGLDIGAIVSGINQPLPLVRFQFLVQKAAEICQEAKSLGNSLLSAIEKEDNEALALIRARHERVILDMAETVKYAQWQEAIKAREGLEKSLLSAAQRYTYYERLLGRKESEIKVAELEALDKSGLERTNLNASEPNVEPRGIEVDIAQDLGASGGKIMSSHESTELNLLEGARGLQVAAAVYDIVGSALSLIPQYDANGEPLGVGVSVEFGGVQLSKMYSMMGSSIRIGADQLSYEASKAAKIGSYARREQEWAFQSNLVAGEITQMFKQLRAAQIREAIAEREWKNHQQQIKNAEEIELFLKGEATPVGDKKHTKTSTQDFYAWMKREVKGLYGQVFQFAFDVAKKAERALQHELGDPSLSYLQFGYLSGKEGLLAGEKLWLDIKRMEMAYHDLNQREYELTKHVSLLQVSPLALLHLRITGRCTVFLPEGLFDMDGPGHYFRRIKSVALSIPCVTGPYTSVNCTLTLLKSSIRKTPLLRDGIYARESTEDDRFSDHFGSLQSIVTSSGQNDSGLFETNLHDERYLPFEGSGVISEWQLELPNNPSQGDPRQFDYDTISDVILHIRYMAREGGVLLRKGAIENQKAAIEAAETAGSVRLFSVRHEFPNQWVGFKAAQTGGTNPPARLTVEIRPEHFPFWATGRLEEITEVELYAQKGKDSPSILPLKPAGSVEIIARKPDGNESKETLNDLASIDLPEPPDTFVLRFSLDLDDNKVEDLWLALRWGSAQG